MNENLKQLVDKKFSVYVLGEFEGHTDFIGVMKRLANFSDFFNYEKKDQVRAVKDWIKRKSIYVDFNIDIRFK